MTSKSVLHPDNGFLCEGDLSMLLEKVYSDRGWDFRNYKKSSLKRRIAKRFAAHHISSYSDYCALLDKDPAEYDRLFSTLTIKVSEFFREPEIFEFISKELKSLPGNDEGIRGWCCACANGEEAHSLAITLSESLSPEALKKSKVFATDIDIDALETARRARYREDALRNVSEEMLAKYFFHSDGQFKLKYDIRNIIKFGHLDIVRSPSISRINILFCRNLFIYFNKALQEAVFGKLHFALRPGGLLVLGKAEVVPPSFAPEYREVGERMSVYRKI